MTDSEPICVLRNHHGFCSIQGTGKARVTCSGFKSDCNFHDTSHMRKQITRHNTSVSSVVATKISSGFNQTATAIFVGKRGKGKSMTAGSIMESYAAKMCVMQKQNPWEATPETYFTIENVGIIDINDILRALKLMKEPNYRFNGFILDDIGKTLDSREFMTTKNKLLNKIFQTCRTKNVFTEMTIPDDSGLDKDPRENSDYFGIMEQPIFEHNLSIGRFFEQNKQYRSGEMWYMYVRSKGSPIVRHAFKSPSQKYIDAYEPRRVAMADKLFNESMIELDGIINKIGDDVKKERVTKRGLLIPAVDGVIAEFGCTLKKACDIIGVEIREYHRMKKGDVT